ncbi:hypothetical protein SETIT_7G115100v2 [Setaria italica]|uniref:Uncharacterized protein n=1 Tax=Setaria italica TaxID=4555 RepID=A0A368RUK8_SETIT|nr:hypothetical protein SETIT_7G115100v2 [Setaria italica]
MVQWVMIGSHDGVVGQAQHMQKRLPSQHCVERQKGKRKEERERKRRRRRGGGSEEEMTLGSPKPPPPERCPKPSEATIHRSPPKPFPCAKPRSRLVAPHGLPCGLIPRSHNRATTRKTFKTPTTPRRTHSTMDKVSCHSQSYRSCLCSLSAA